MRKGAPLCQRNSINSKSFGSSKLHGKDKEEWEGMLDKLKKMPPTEVYNVMKLSYDDLDHKGKEILLDLACFFLERK